MIAQFVHFQLKQVGQIFGAGVVTGATATLIGQRNVDIPEFRVGSLQVFECDLRIGECRFDFCFSQLLLHLEHGFDRQRQFFQDNFIPVVGLQDRPASDAPYDRLYPVADTRLRGGEQFEVFLVGLIAKGMTVANHLEGGHDELLLLLRQMPLLLTALRATATGTAASLLGAPEIFTEGAHLVKEDIAGRGFGLVYGSPVLGVYVIGNQVARAQTEILEVNDMLGVDLLPGVRLIRRR